MTIKELSQLYNIEKEIEWYDQRIDTLRAQRTAISAPAFDKEPGGKSDPSHSKIEALTAEIIDLEEILSLNRKQAGIECIRLERYIATVPDATVRRIMHLRFFDLKPWTKVAREMNYTESAVKMRLQRFLESTETENEKKEKRKPKT